MAGISFFKKPPKNASGGKTSENKFTDSTEDSIENEDVSRAADTGSDRIKEAPRIPTLEQIEAERKRLRNLQYRTSDKGREYLILVAAIILTAILTALITSFAITTVGKKQVKISDSSMGETLKSGNAVQVTTDSDELKNLSAGEIIAFTYNDETVVERIIGCPGDWVDIDDDGNVTVNGADLSEPYVTNKSLNGSVECDISLPYQVPDGQYFVMGDDRKSSLDSRSTQMGCITKDQIVGVVSEN